MKTSFALTQDNRTHWGLLRRLMWVGPLTIAAATAANFALYAVAGRVDPEVTAWPGAGPQQIAGATFGYLAIGLLVFALVVRFSPRPARHYRVMAAVGLVLSLALPLTAGFALGPGGEPPAGTATVITLSLMHIISFAISTPLLIRLGLRSSS